MTENIQYSMVGFHLMKVSSCSSSVAPPNTPTMAKLTHSIVSTLPCLNFVQMIWVVVAIIATRVARKIAGLIPSPKTMSSEVNSAVAVSGWVLPNLKKTKNRRTGNKSNSSFMALAVRLVSVQRERGRVNAKAQPGWRWTIRENMTKVCRALFAAHFHACHAVTGVGSRHDVFGFIGLPKTRPSAAGIEFGCGIKQGVAATHAAINSRIMAIPICTCKRCLGAALATYLVLLRREFVAPFGIGFCNWCSH